jgi:hypothetical protein
MVKKSGTGYEMNSPDHISESLETNFLGLKYFNSLMQIRDPGWKKNSDPGWKIIPDPQHWNNLVTVFI